MQRNKQDGYHHRSHNKTKLLVHIVLVTKYRKPILVGNCRITVKQLLYESAERHHWYIQAMKTDRDHIHILLQYPPNDSIKRIVSILKQESTYHVSKRMLLSWETIIGLNIHCGQMVILRQVSEMPHRRPFRNISPIRVNKNAPKVATFPHKIDEGPCRLRGQIRPGQGKCLRDVV